MIAMHASRPAGLLAVAATVLFTTSPGPADDPPNRAKPDAPSQPKNTPLDSDLWSTPLGRPFELLVRGERSRFGWFDADGNFIPAPLHESFRPMGPGGGPFSFVFTNHVRRPCPMGEHRSGRLILGTMVKGVFIPEIGSKVLDLKKDFDVKNPERMIYNLHDAAAAKFWTEKQRKEFPKGFPDVPEPPAAGVPDGWKLVPLWQDTFDKQDRWHVRVIGEIAEFGHLDDRGEFIPDYGLPVVSRSGLLGSLRNNPSFDFPRRYYTLPVDGAKTEDVYEFRSGRLIKGTLHDTGNFVPEVGSTVIDFKDYDPFSRLRVYNLPGVLRPVKK
jgi:hypothetical protein